MTHRERGVTLFEILIATTLAMILILAITQVDMTRVYISEDIRRNLNRNGEAELALTHMGKWLQMADRVVVVSANNVQFRVPVPTEAACQPIPTPDCFDRAANYTWGQYRYDSGLKQILFYYPVTSSCPTPITYGQAPDSSLAGLTVTYNDADSTQQALGSDPPSPDNNLLQIKVISEGVTPSTNRPYQSQVVLRAGAYTNLNATAQNSSSGMEPTGSISSAPNPC